MIQWEYTTRRFPEPNDKENPDAKPNMEPLEKLLNDAGLEGWEYVGPVSHHSAPSVIRNQLPVVTLFALFKRMKPDG